MSHFMTLVIVPNGDGINDIKNKVTGLLAPYDENGEWFKKGTRWDWWMIGGRFTGSLTDYDPETDPRNIETCFLCCGTGKRKPSVPNEFNWCGGCNGCKGTGKNIKHPGEWAAYDKDILPIKEIKNPSCYAMVLPDGRWAERGKMGWFGMAADESSKEKWLEFVKKTLKEHEDKIAVVVDCHV